MRRGRPDQAIDHYERLARLQPDNAVLLGNLAAAYAANGESGRAVQAAHTALQRAIAEKNDALAYDLNLRVQEYEAAERAAVEPARRP